MNGKEAREALEARESLTDADGLPTSWNINGNNSAYNQKPEPKPKIIQLIEIDDCFLGLADNGAVYERLGDKWTIFMDPLRS